MKDEIVEFTIAATEVELDDLRNRVRRTRWPEPATTPGWSQGVPLDHLQDLCRYWVDGHDWRRAEAALNAWPNARTEIDGLDIHFLHARSPYDSARPLLLTHGWPGSVLEFTKLIAPLVDPVLCGGRAADAFHVVLPSLPGYGFSGRPTQAGWGIGRTAAAWATLMARLGYSHYGAAGTDWGTSITTVLAQLDSTHISGVHLVPPLAPPDPATLDSTTDFETDALNDLKRAAADGSAYAEMHRTRPQTIGYALVDSPVALCAWMSEKFHDWSDRTHDDSRLTRDDVLDAVTLYWLSSTGASAARLYRESIAQVSDWISGATSDTVLVPVGASVFGFETPRVSQRWAARRFSDIRLWRHHDRGGHFASLEYPDLVINDLRDFYRLI